MVTPIAALFSSVTAEFWEINTAYGRTIPVVMARCALVAAMVGLVRVLGVLLSA